ncbi:MAG: hypothetical protein ABIY51_16260 [Ferruginibacter sp.]
MKVFCKECNLPLTNELMHYTGKSFGLADGQHFIQKGFYTISDGDFFTGTNGSVIINNDDQVNIINHTNPSKLSGCCGLDGTRGNKTCANGHEMATEYSDCWMPFAVVFEKEKIIIK